jgi:hypothetical protein
VAIRGALLALSQCSPGAGSDHLLDVVWLPGLVKEFDARAVEAQRHGREFSLLAFRNLFDACMQHEKE